MTRLRIEHAKAVKRNRPRPIHSFRADEARTKSFDPLGRSGAEEQVCEEYREVPLVGLRAIEPTTG
jgi:hypothetical protein